MRKSRRISLVLRHLAALLACLASSSISFAKVTITPGSAVVNAGSTEKFRANQDVEWSLAPGGVGTIDPDGTYHAPVALAAKHTMAGCQVLPNDHIFNTRIDSLPVYSNSSALIAIFPPSRPHYLESWGINIADKTTPRKRMHFAYTPQSDGVYILPQWPYLKMESGALARVDNTDRHILTVDKDDCSFWDIYDAYDKGKNSSCPDCTGQSGLHYAGMTYDLPPGGATDAAGLPLAALSLHLEDIASGAIRHALRVTLQNNFIAPTNIWPATSHAGPWGKIPYGTRFRLRNNFDASRMSPIAKILVTQLKQYGLILADGGANWEVDVSTDVTESPALMDAFAEVSGSAITSRDFEIVDESGLIAAPGSGRVRPDNPAVKPDTSVTVMARSKSKPNEVAEAAIAIRAVTVGMPDPAIWIQSGVTKKLDFWVRGSSNQGLQWKLDPPLGSIGADGSYTAPDVSAPTTTTLVATSDTDPAAKAFLLVTVVPKGPIRVDIGGATGAPGTPHSHAPNYGPDSEGHMWWRDLGQEWAWGTVTDNWYGLPWPKIPDIGLYYTVRYASGDMLFRYFVPDGHYKITLMFAAPCKGTLPLNNYYPIHLESQRKIVARNFDWGAGNGRACSTPSVVTIPAAVTDNSLEFALRRGGIGNAFAAPTLNAYKVEPTSEPPHIAIDPEHPSDISAGRTQQFRAVGWFTDDAVTWSVAEGPGTIDPNGIYTAPATPTAKQQRVVVVAKSTSDPSKYVRTEFSFVSGDLTLNPVQVNVYRGLSQKFDVQLGGVPYKNVSWSVAPSVGTVDASGVYHAPETLPHDEDVVVTAASRDVAGKSVSAKLHLKVKADPIRINCGDQGGFRDAKGNEWSGDTGFSPSVGYHQAVPIKNTTPDLVYLYQSQRYRYKNESFFYSFDLPNGAYEVTLMFADYTNDHPVKDYIFDVKLNGKQVLTRFNPDDIVGGRSAIDKTFTVDVTTHNLRLDFTGDGGLAFVNGIQILPVSRQ